ncbi:hypothetical protein [Mesorhizobium sp. KR1-2]|uniref:hypothetical protein n=1 Tax=Mesorhizobium sp. KR1-2 TaxID=3156609 RepID=UPI0032B53121
MKKFSLVAALAVALAGSACSKAPECTTETLAKKAQEMTTALQEVVAKDPAKAMGLVGKVQQITQKYQDAKTSLDACRAYDELIAAIKG